MEEKQKLIYIWPDHTWYCPDNENGEFSLIDKLHCRIRYLRMRPGLRQANP